MKFEIDDAVLIDSIVDKIVDRLTPLIKASSTGCDSGLMSVIEVSKYLGVKVSWLYGKIYTREIPFQKVGKFPRFRKKDIDLWTMNPYHPDLSNYNLNHVGRMKRKP